MIAIVWTIADLLKLWKAPEPREPMTVTVRYTVWVEQDSHLPAWMRGPSWPTFEERTVEVPVRPFSLTPYIEERVVEDIFSLDASVQALSADCPICREKMSHAAVLSPCGHVFDHDCIMSWLQAAGGWRKQATCPYCTATIKTVTRVEKNQASFFGF